MPGLRTQQVSIPARCLTLAGHQAKSNNKNNHAHYLLLKPTPCWVFNNCFFVLFCFGFSFSPHNRAVTQIALSSMYRQRNQAQKVKPWIQGHGRAGPVNQAGLSPKTGLWPAPPWYPHDARRSWNPAWTQGTLSLFNSLPSEWQMSGRFCSNSRGHNLVRWAWHWAEARAAHIKEFSVGVFCSTGEFGVFWFWLVFLLSFLNFVMGLEMKTQFLPCRISTLRSFRLSLAVIIYHDNQHALCARHYSNCFAQNDSLNLCNLIRQSLSISPFHQYENWDPERLSNLLKVIHLVI